MAMPVRMKPICDIEEQASVRLRFTENTASTAPPSIVMSASTSSMLPQARLSRKMFAETAMMPKMPDLVRMPESSADAGAGATGCALGSQMCSGNMPAFAPKPKRMHSPAAQSAPRLPHASAAAYSSEMVSVPRVIHRMNRPTSITMPPMMATARYVSAARIAPGVSSCATQV